MGQLYFKSLEEFAAFFGYRCTSTLIGVGRKAQGLLLSCPHSYFYAACRKIEGMTAGSGLAGHS